MVAQLAPAHRSGRTFGGYGASKSLGYAAGPLLGSALVLAGPDVIGGHGAVVESVLLALLGSVFGWWWRNARDMPA